MDRIGRQILGELVKYKPRIALDVVVSSKLDDDGLGMANGISFESRNLIFQNLPKRLDWAQIAESTKNSVFYPGEPAAAVFLQGPGPELFARWAEDQPGEAIGWFKKKKIHAKHSIIDQKWGG